MEYFLAAVIGAVLLIIFFWRDFCFKHGTFKRRIHVSTSQAFLQCKKCVEDEENPKVKCKGCGWKGRFMDLLEESYSEDTKFRNFCPNCEAEVKL